MTIEDDPYRWLENVEGEAAGAWVRDRNAETVAALTDNDRFAALQAQFREVLDSEDRIPLPIWRGEHLYNLWKDRDHPRGLWRRTTLDEYRRPEPRWDVLLDIDALAAEEDENWVWHDVTVLRPGYRRCLISLSRGGADASVVREFDLDERTFVKDGFTLPEAKSYIGWIDESRIYVGTDFGAGSLTSSGYPRLVKEWCRGTPLSEATPVYEGHDDDVVVYAVHDPTAGHSRDLVTRAVDFYRDVTYLRTADGNLTRVDVPEDAEIDVHREWLLVRLRSPWTTGSATYPAGALLVTHFDTFLDSDGDRDLTVLFEPDAHTSLSSYHWTRNHVILVMLHDVKSRLVVCTPSTGGWLHTLLVDAQDASHTEVVSTNQHHTDEYLLSAAGFTQPTTLRYARVGGEVEALKQEPTFFDATGLSVRQLYATSADGTRVPYFVVGPERSQPGPTLLNGYGGFEISRTPAYSGIIGRGWLARGGTYVVANIRGGGEYGPAWHRSALRENRPRAYEDFAAVATDLVDRGITSTPQLGIEGGSNGGLLTGVMLTRYPTLFGAVVCQVPLLDMRRYHELLAGASWMAEYGDPDQESDWAYLKGFSPYHNVHSGRSYPPVLFATSTRDDRVHPGHARKMVARMLEYGYDVAYYENVEGGHGGAADNAQLAFKSALVLEFLWRQLNPP
jgi:prolyl oligopeptidase